jgi:prevent-host-death family protein
VRLITAIRHEQTTALSSLTVDLFMDYIKSYRKRGILMKLSNQIRPISYLKAHAAEIVRNLSKQQEPLVITQNGEGKVLPAEDVIKRLRERRENR